MTSSSHDLSQKDVDKEEAALSEMRREISSVKEMEYKITKEDVVFKNKRDKADSLVFYFINLLYHFLIIIRKNASSFTRLICSRS